jgi:hypothetical protein
MPLTGPPRIIPLEQAIDQETHELRRLRCLAGGKTPDRTVFSVCRMVDPLVRGIFERVIRETQKHYDLIESEYAYVMGMVHESDQDIYVRE